MCTRRRARRSGSGRSASTPSSTWSRAGSSAGRRSVTDPVHRIPLLTPVDPKTGLTGFNSIDGSTYDPFTKKLLLTQETSSSSNGTGAVIQVTLDWPPKVTTLEPFLGLGGYEGIHPDDRGN